MKAFLCIVVLMFSQSALSADANELETTMKNMGLAYKQSVQATDLEKFNLAIDEFINLVEASQLAKFSKEAAKSVRGLNKVLDKAKLAKKLANEEGLEAARVPLKSIDRLRKDYHEIHEPPGFWELLFGK